MTREEEGNRGMKTSGAERRVLASIGVTLGVRKNSSGGTCMYVQQLAQGGAAAKSGAISIGDVLLQVDGVDVTRKSAANVCMMFLGEVGTYAKLILQRPAVSASGRSKTVVVQIERQILPASEVSDTLPQGLQESQASWLRSGRTDGTDARSEGISSSRSLDLSNVSQTTKLSPRGQGGQETAPLPLPFDTGSAPDAPDSAAPFRHVSREGARTNMHPYDISQNQLSPWHAHESNV